MPKYKPGDVVRIANDIRLEKWRIGQVFIIGKVSPFKSGDLYHACPKTKQHPECFEEQNIVKLNPEESEKFIKETVKEVYGPYWKYRKAKVDAHGTEFSSREDEPEFKYAACCSATKAWSIYSALYSNGQWAEVYPFQTKDIPDDHKKDKKFDTKPIKKPDDIKPIPLGETNLCSLSGINIPDLNDHITNNKSKIKGKHVEIQNLRRKAKTIRKGTGTRGSRVASKRRKATARVRHSRNRKGAIYG